MQDNYNNTKIISTAIAVGCLLGLTSCASLQNSMNRAAMDLKNAKAHVVCYSGGQTVLDIRTATKPRSEENSDGYYTKVESGYYRAGDKTITINKGAVVEVSGDCFIIYDK